MLDGALDNFAKVGRYGRYDPSTWGPLMRMGTMHTTSPGLSEKERGGYQCNTLVVL
jgi:hypothetical protein